MGEGRTDRPERLTVAQCADRLGISEDAVRSRIKRGTLLSEKFGGVVHVLLGADRRPTDKTTDQADQPASDYRDELIAELRDRVRSLEEANRENRRLLLLALQERQLEAPESASEGADRGEEAWETRTEPQSTGEQESAPWWRRIFNR